MNGLKCLIKIEAKAAMHGAFLDISRHRHDDYSTIIEFIYSGRQKLLSAIELGAMLTLWAGITCLLDELIRIPSLNCYIENRLKEIE
jgi:hypothetical protein